MNMNRNNHGYDISSSYDNINNKTICGLEYQNVSTNCCSDAIS